MAQRQSNNAGPLNRLTTGVSGLIGLATELHAYNKGNKAVNQRASETAPSSPSSSPRYPDDPPEYSNEPQVSDGRTDTHSNLVGDNVDRPSGIQPLPLPVILPQRRPKSKSRGFIRGYAPDLWHYKGIDRQTFLAFLKEFHKSSQASPVFQVINVAAMAAGFAPSAIAMAVSAAVAAASKAAMEVQSRYRTNQYLDRANEELFHPKNLHCLIMTFKPDSPDDAFLSFNFNSSIFNIAPTTSNIPGKFGGRSQSRLADKFRKSSGTTEGQLELPEAAALVFPDPETSSAGEGTGANVDAPEPPPNQQSSWKSTRKFVSDYKDRRAQAAFAGKHGEGSTLAVPGATNPDNFASCFSDPNHPVNSGSPLALLTAGKFESADQIKAKFAQLTGTSQRASPVDRLKDGIIGLAGKNGQQMSTRPGVLGGFRGFMQQDILYLLIAEIPSSEEMLQLNGEMSHS
ncbi:hypothetical protein RBB50_010008 [Rhinocladiella similis]